MQRRNTGALGEKYARDFLKKKGYKVIESNYRCKRGEIDIIAKQKKSLVFVEVRTKMSLEFGTPEESINRLKQNHMRNAALNYLQDQKSAPESWRIDVVAVELNEKGKPSRIELIENAVGDG